MERLKFIYEDERGVTCFDRYFAYLSSIAEQLPAEVREFACDHGRYELNGPRTLHDSWLAEFRGVNDYSDSAAVSRELRVVLLLPSHRRTVSMTYSRVHGFSASMTPTRWPTKPVDLLVHEFSVLEDGLVRHVVEFDSDSWYEVVFSEFSFVERDCISDR